MSRTDKTESEKKIAALRKKVFFDSALQVLPEASRKPIKTTVTLAEHWVEDKRSHPEASTLEHVVAVGAQTAAEMAVKYAVLKGAKAIHLEATASAPGKLVIGDVAKPIADPLGKKANETVHQLFADVRVANPTEEMHTQWQQSWEQQNRAERLHESLDVAGKSMQARNAAAELVPLRMQINVPLPSVPLKINASDSVETVCSKMDRYFDDIIRDYPDSTKRLLREMYYNNKNIDVSKNYLEKKAMQANWDADHSGNSTVFRMTIDSRLRQCPVMFRCCKIHEIAIHIGQAHQTVEQAGWDTLYREIRTFNQFTEQSVALAEKILHDALPQEVIARDLKNISDLSVLGAMQYDCSVRKVMNIDDYTHLQHRDDKLTPSDHEVFLRHPNVSLFLERKVQQFYPGVEARVISTYVYRTALENITKLLPETESLHAAYTATSSTALIPPKAIQQRPHSYERHIAHLNSFVRNQTELQRQHFARMGMPEPTGFGHSGGAGIRVYGRTVSNEEYAKRLDPAKRAVFEDWLRSRLPFATAEASEKPVVVRRADSQPHSQRSAYHLQRQFLDEAIVPVHSTIAQHVHQALVAEFKTQRSQTLDAVTQPISFHAKINVPLPSKKFSINPSDTTEVVCAKIDAYFEDIIRNFPETTKTLQRKMYYHDNNVSQEDLTSGQAAGLAWCEKNIFGVLRYKVKVHSELARSPIAFRMIKIHEIGVHIGQIHQRIEQVGFQTFVSEYNQLAKFTEQSVAIAEKIMKDAMPAKVLADSVNSGRSGFSNIHFILDTIFDCYVSQVVDHQKTTFDDYVHLGHRSGDDKLTPTDHELFLLNPQVASFLESKVQQFYPGVETRVVSTYVYRTALEKITRSFQTIPAPHYAVTATGNAHQTKLVISLVQKAIQQHAHSYERHLAHLNSSVRNQTELQRQHFARMGMHEYAMFGHSGGAGIRVYGTAVSNEAYAKRLDPAKRAVFEDWLRSRLPFATAEASEKPVVVRRADFQPHSQRSAYHLQRQFLDEVTVSAHSTTTQHVAKSHSAVQSHHALSTNAITAHLTAKQIDELRHSTREANKVLRERSQFHQEQIAHFQMQRSHDIISTSGELFGLASRVCRYAGNNETAQFFSSTFSLFSGFCTFILSGSPLGLIMPFVSFFLNNRAAEEARRFAKMIEAASQSLDGLHQDVISELQEFQILLQKEIRFTGALVAEVLAEQNTCHRLNDVVFNELAILESTMGKHFENTNAYLHVLMTHDLKTKCEHLQSVLNETNAVQPSIKQIRQDLHDLEFWIMSRLHHPMMNGANYLNATSEEATAILSQQAYPLITMPSFVAGRVYCALGENIPPTVLSLPPMTLYFSTIQLFCKVLVKHPELLGKNKGEAVFAQILDTLTTYSELISFIKMNEMKISQSQLSAEEKEIILKPLADILVYETAVLEMKRMIAGYQKQLQFLTDPVQQLEALTRAFFYPHGDAPESQGTYWKCDSQTEQSISCVMDCREFDGSRELQREFINKLVSRNVRAVATTINEQRFLQVQLVTTVIPIIMSANFPSFFKHARPALLDATTNTNQPNQPRGI